MSAERVAWIREWHQAAYEAALDEGEGGQHFTYHGLELDVPADVMPITASSHLLGDAVRERAHPGSRVLDMGCGCGVNAILAAREGARVLAVDVHEGAVIATRANAAANGVAGRVEARVSDVFSSVEGEFDLVVFDPPYRWFEPRDPLEAAMSDPGTGPCAPSSRVYGTTWRRAARSCWASPRRGTSTTCAASPRAPGSTRRPWPRATCASAARASTTSSWPWTPARAAGASWAGAGDPSNIGPRPRGRERRELQ